MLSLTATGCADPEPRTVSLVVEQIFGTTFAAMDRGVEHTNDDNIVVTKDMRTQPGYTELRPELVCVGLDTSRSYLEVLQMTATGGEAAFSYTFEIREVGGIAWTELGQLTTTISQNSSVFMSEPAWTVNSNGLQLLNLIALSDKPQYEVRFTGIATDAPIDSLEVEVHLELKFANFSADCP